MNATAIATIHLDALVHNLAEIRALFPQQKIIAMIKSNAYGHGLVPVAQALSSTNAFGVATLGEALQLRNAGVTNDLVVMRGFVSTDEIPVFLEDNHLLACIHSIDQVMLLEQLNRTDQRPLRIWLKIDTGMHRLGIPGDAFNTVFQRLLALSWVHKPFVVCSHLADADNQDKAFTHQQIVNFEHITRDIAVEKSLLNSAGILAHNATCYEWLRPGLMLYGISPFCYAGEHDMKMQSFKPAMTLTSKLIAIKTVNAGEKIGYSCTFTAPRAIKIGIIGMGYGDSYPRYAKNGTPVLIRGERCPIVGRVSMDMITVDISHLDIVAVNDTVILWGQGLPVSEIARYMNTVPHELICHLTGRVQAVYVT